MRDFRSLRTKSLQISIPRSRNGKFKPILLELINTEKDQLNQLCVLLYQRGLSTRDVASIMEEFFGEAMSKDTISNLASSFHDIRKKWSKRRLGAYYEVIYCAALYTNLKLANSYSKEALPIIYGVKDGNTRELLLLEVSLTESSKVWGEYLDKLRKRGVEQVELIGSDSIYLLFFLRSQQTLSIGKYSEMCSPLTT